MPYGMSKIFLLYCLSQRREPTAYLNKVPFLFYSLIITKNKRELTNAISIDRACQVIDIKFITYKRHFHISSPKLYVRTFLLCAVCN